MSARECVHHVCRLCRVDCLKDVSHGPWHPHAGSSPDRMQFPSQRYSGSRPKQVFAEHRRFWDAVVVFHSCMDGANGKASPL